MLCYRLPRILAVVLAFTLVLLSGCIDSTAPKRVDPPISAKVVDGAGGYCWWEYSSSGAQGQSVGHLVCIGAGTGLGSAWSNLSTGWWGGSLNPGFGFGEQGGFDGRQPTISPMAVNPYGANGITTGCDGYDDCWLKLKTWLNSKLSRALNEAEKAAVVAAVQAQLLRVPPDVRGKWVARLVSSNVAGEIVAGIKAGDIATILARENPLLFHFYPNPTLDRMASDPKYHGFAEFVDFLVPLTDFFQVDNTRGDGKRQSIIIVPIASFEYVSGGVVYTSRAAAEYIILYPPPVDGQLYVQLAGGLIVHRCMRLAPGAPGIGASNPCGQRLSGATYPWDN